MNNFIKLAKKALNELKVGNPRTIATDTYAHNNKLIHEFEAAIKQLEELENSLILVTNERNELKTWLEDQVCEAKDFAYRLENKTTELAELQTKLEELEPCAWMITTENTNLHYLDMNRECNWLAFDCIQFEHDKARALNITQKQPLYDLRGIKE